MDDNLLPDQPARIIVAMSGGVDSSTAAALLVEAGHQVSGLMARLWRDPQVEADVQGAEKSARQVCAHLGIPFQALDLREHFRAQVVNYFAAEYAQGRTPNPCLACNRQIKFGALLRWARANGADYLATGHYARRRQVKGRYQLLRGADPSKDQSYVLYALDQRTLAQVLFPLGSYDKEHVRQMARARGLAAADRDESQEICFIPDNDYRRFMQAHYPKAIRPGAIYDTLGQRIGTHQGLAFYTIGQRKGLGISAAEPLYVMRIDRASNGLVVGRAEELGQSQLVAQEVTFVSGQAPSDKVTAKIRYKAREAQAILSPLGNGRALVTFAEPLRDITPGQAVVFYQGEVVLGGGIISDQLEEG